MNFIKTDLSRYKKFSTFVCRRVNKDSVIKRAINHVQDSKILSEHNTLSAKQMEYLEKLNKKQKLTAQEVEDMEYIKDEYSSFFESDSESESNGKTISWQKSKTQEVRDYINSEINSNQSQYESLAEKNKEYFNILTDKVTNKKHINVKPEFLREFNESQNTDQSIDKQLETSNVSNNKNDTVSDIKGKGKAISDSELKDISEVEIRKTNPNVSSESPGEYIDSLPAVHNPFDDLGDD